MSKGFIAKLIPIRYNLLLNTYSNTNPANQFSNLQSPNSFLLFLNIWIIKLLHVSRDQLKIANLSTPVAPFRYMILPFCTNTLPLNFYDQLNLLCLSVQIVFIFYYNSFFIFGIEVVWVYIWGFYRILRIYLHLYLKTYYKILSWLCILHTL